MMTEFNRRERRKIAKKGASEILDTFKRDATTIMFAFWIDVLHDHGYTPEQISELAADAVERYNSWGGDMESYKRKVYEKTGIGLLRG